MSYLLVPQLCCSVPDRQSQVIDCALQVTMEGQNLAGRSRATCSGHWLCPASHSGGSELGRQVKGCMLSEGKRIPDSSGRLCPAHCP